MLYSSIRTAGLNIQKRFASTILSRDEIKRKLLNVLRNYDKVEAAKLTMECDFNKDLGLDSLDVVEVVMAVEEEFDMEIPDSAADKMTSPQDVADYIEQNIK